MAPVHESPALLLPSTAARADRDRGLVSTTVTDRRAATIHLYGEMDLANANLLPGAVADQLRLGRRFLRLDLSALDFLDCAGLRAIIQCHHATLAVDGSLTLVGVSARTARLLAIVGLDAVLVVAGLPSDPRPAADQARTGDG